MGSSVPQKDGFEVVMRGLESLPLVGPLIRHRFTKFGAVGLFGMGINLIVLYLGQEILFKGIHPEEIRLYLSLGAAIFLATLNNFLWNRTWTWGDREGRKGFGFFVQMGQYFAACGVAIGIQYVFTVLFATIVHYLVANVSAIALAAVFTYLLNDVWTFSARGSAGGTGRRRDGEVSDNVP